MSLRIREILKCRDITIDDFANDLGLNQGQVSRFLSGKRRANTDFLSAAAKYLDLPVSALFDRPQLQVVGYIGAGSELNFQDSYAHGDGLETIDAPLDSLVGTVAVRVRGQSMWPSYFDGDVLIYSDPRHDVDAFMHQRVVCRLVDERILVKTLMPGSRPGLYNLISFNAEPIEDIALEWVAKIECVVPR